MNSTQLDLWEDELAELPWRGQSPRALTRVGLALFSTPERAKHERFFVDAFQRDLFRAAIQGPPRYGGAPLLVPLRPRGR